MADRPKLATLKPRVAMAHGNVKVAGSHAWNDDRRASSAARGYGHAWRKQRVRIMERDNYVCQCDDCKGGLLRLRAANDVDHIVSKAEWQMLHGNLDGVDHDGNLQAINHACHVIKTARDRVRAFSAVDHRGGSVTAKSAL